MSNQNLPLAERLRPSSLDSFFGQDHLTGENGVLKKMLKSKVLPSLIFWGPPGVGKTTLANIIANEMNMPFHTLSAISSGVKDVREMIQRARSTGKIILFIDEIHRFNKGQQDALLAAVEKGWVILIGATTENPSFEVNSALLSRCQVYTLNSLDEDELKKIIEHALGADPVLKSKTFKFNSYSALFRFSDGDARKLLNLLEVLSYGAEDNIVVDDERVMEVAQKKAAKYDKGADNHYDFISAFIKSIRGSDPNAAIYWMARMIQGGEDPKFIARRMLILASEDIGNANPTALVIANNCFDAVMKIGYPEARIILAQAATYLASSPKSNASYMAINRALQEAENTGDKPVPLHLRGGYTQLNRNLGYGKGYKYSHDYENSFSEQEYMPEDLSGMKFYDPGNNARENEMRKRLKALWKGKYNY